MSVGEYFISQAKFSCHHTACSNLITNISTLHKLLATSQEISSRTYRYFNPCKCSIKSNQYYGVQFYETIFCTIVKLVVQRLCASENLTTECCMQQDYTESTLCCYTNAVIKKQQSI
jgi:hypothetical protein